MQHQRCYPISIHALREEGDTPKMPQTARICISIHALREEGDMCPNCMRLKAHISIHALREEGDYTYIV